MQQKLHLVGLELLNRFLGTAGIAAIGFGIIAAFVVWLGTGSIAEFFSTLSPYRYIIAFGGLACFASVLLARNCAGRAKEIRMELREESRERAQVKKAERAILRHQKQVTKQLKVVPAIPTAASTDPQQRTRAEITDKDTFIAGRQVGYPAYWPELRQIVLDRDAYRCGNCGRNEDLHVHHIIPLSLGGSNELGNLRTLCRSCHAKLHPHMRGE